MSLQVEKLEKNMAKLTIEVSAEELEKAIDGAYQKNKNKISIPGFRKGKAPRKMIEQMYGKSVFYEDAANALIPDAYDKACLLYTSAATASMPFSPVKHLPGSFPDSSRHYSLHTNDPPGIAWQTLSLIHISFFMIIKTPFLRCFCAS